MACYHPSDVLVRPKGAARQVLNPVTVPCGHCIGCRTDQARDWAVRLMHETEFPRVQPNQQLRASWFVTLTYSPENLPDNGSLNPEDPTRFLKRLRKRYPPGSLSYFLCGEYGESTHRPHYHAVFSGPAFLDRDLHTCRNGVDVWTSSTLDAAWGLGFVEFTGVTYAAARYVAGYVTKKLRQKDHDRVNPLTGELLEQEFSRSSRNPAIGRRWLERYWRDVYPADYVLADGYPVKPPRYYDKFMDLPDDKGGSAERREIMSQVRDQRWKDLVEISDERLIMKERVHRARHNLFQSRDRV